MTEYEWETSRVPRPPKAEFLASHRPHDRAVAEFAGDVVRIEVDVENPASRGTVPRR